MDKQKRALKMKSSFHINLPKRKIFELKEFRKEDVKTPTPVPINTGYSFQNGNWDKHTEMLLSEPEQITLLTYNIWFRLQDFEKRMNNLFLILSQKKADIICLQEVTPRSLDLILKNDFIRSNYLLSTNCSLEMSPYGVLMMVSKKLPLLGFCNYYLKSIMSRNLLVAKLKNFSVATSHLESLHHINTRCHQIVTATKILKDEHCVWAGDFNFGDTSEYESNILCCCQDWVDIAKNVGSTERIIHESGDGTRRLDRVLLKSKSWKAIDVNKEETYISDHYGLEVTFKVI